ncbi:MAG: ABC transporter ATP-binding protein [Bdellovibrionia bacterium]
MSIRFCSVTKSFPGKTVLKDVSFEVNSREILFILGKSGMGKSVTLKHIIGLMKPDQGEILVDGQAVTSMTPEQLTEVRRKCGMVFQNPALLDSLSVLENVAFGLKTPQFMSTLSTPWTPEKIQERVIETLALVNLSSDILELKPAELSFGMQKRVSIARTLAAGPSYLLFDEPTTGLDPITTQFINDLILDLSRKLHVTSIVVSHDMGCALKIADRILVLDQGQVLEHATVPQIRASQKPLIRDFLAEVSYSPPPAQTQCKLPSARSFP